MSRSRILSGAATLAVAGALYALPAPALYAQSAPRMKRVSLENGHLSFLVPSNFRALTESEIKFKFPRQRPPKVVYANAAQSVSIAVNFTIRFPSLATAKSVFDKILPQNAPSFHWIKDGYSTINGKSWVDLEFTTAAIDTTIHNNELFALLPDESVILNLNATVESYPKAAPLFRAVKNSLTIRP